MSIFFNTARKLHMSTLMQNQYTSQTGISLVIVIILIAVISAIVLPMARTTILEEKIAKNHNWLNMSYTQTRGEVYKQSSSEQLSIQQLLTALENKTTAQNNNLIDHETAIHYRGQNGIPFGYSLDRFRGFQFDVVTEAHKEATGSYNKQLIGLTYVANSH